ncbi:putative PDZ domain-containing protein PDZK1P1 [Manis javanica]|nr:putative PDZ domain-containing protein PDZK1P1 [Manis javanica]
MRLPAVPPDTEPLHRACGVFSPLKKVTPVMLKKALSAIAIATLALTAQAADVLKVGATAVPHAEILNHVKPALKAQGIDLQIKEFSDYVQPNAAVEDKQLDVNFFQHQPYLDSYNKDRKTSLVAVPNGKVHAPKEPDPTPLDVAKNPRSSSSRNSKPRCCHPLADVDLALINTNYAIEAKLNPTKDALFIEGADSPYTNIVVSRQDRANDPNIAKLMNALHTPDVKKFILEKYKGAVVPAF